MKKLIINDSNIELSDKEGVRITRGNPVMDGVDSYTLPIEVSLKSQANRQAVNNMNMLQAIGDRGQEFSAQLLVNGFMLLDGYAVIDELRDDYVEFTLKGNMLDFWKYLEEKGTYLSELSFPEIVPFSIGNRTEAGILAELNSTLTTEKDYVCFPMINKSDLEDSSSTNYLAAGGFNPFSMWTENFYGTIGSYNYTVFLRLGVAFNKIFESLGYSVSYNLFTTADYKDIVLLNVTSITQIMTTFDYSWLLPNITVYEFLNQFRESGVYFDIDTATSTVSIFNSNYSINREIEPLETIVKGSKKITPESKNGYNFSMSSNGAVGENAFIDETLKDYDNLVTRVMNHGYVNRFLELPISSNIAQGVSFFVKSEGCFYQKNSNDEWEKAKGLTGFKNDGDEDIEISSPLSVSLTNTYASTNEVNITRDGEIYPISNMERQITTIDVDSLNFDNIILTVYRGLQHIYYECSDGDPNVRFPYAHYLPYNADGSDIAGISLDTGFFYNLLADKITLLENSYKMEYQFVGGLHHLLRSSFAPLLIDGQKAILKQRSAKITGMANEYLITDTVYVEQETD